jgi:citrate lyase subunit beta/citryl-CoA lyase
MTPPILRSYLFAPGNSERLVTKVFAAGADAVVLDLEDAVPREEKERARQIVRGAVRSRADRTGPALWVRINALRSDDWRRDVQAAVGPGLTGLRVPKAESVQDLALLDEELAAVESSTALASGSIALALTLESAAGVLEAHRLAAAPRVVHLTFGAADFAADVGADPEATLATLWARSRLVAASAAAGIAPPVASVHTRLDDSEALLRSTQEARSLGFFGRSCIHPRQLAVVHEVFTPSPEELARARATVRALEDAAARGAGAVAVGGRLVDEAVARRARRLLELARALEVEVTHE